MNTETIAAIEAALAKATPGPWEASNAATYALNAQGVNRSSIHVQGGYDDHSVRTSEAECAANAELATILLNNVPALLASARNTARFEAEVARLREAVLAVVDATRAYLPPGGIDAQECVNRILSATDNPAINPLILEAENGRY